MMNYNIDFYKEGISKGNRLILSKAISLIENDNKRSESQALLSSLNLNKKSKIIGITGVPGVGKSTFINSFVTQMSSKMPEIKIAILTIDPSSSISHGSILGDKSRMKDIVKLENVYIRPSSNKMHLGGVASTTFDTINLCRAFGFDYIIIETVGVGQSEIELKYLSDIIIYLNIPKLGDELQALKKGIIEVCDIIVLNKIDLFNSNDLDIYENNIKNSFSYNLNKRNTYISRYSSVVINKYDNYFDIIWDNINKIVKDIKVEDRINKNKVIFKNILFNRILNDYIEQNKSSIENSTNKIDENPKSIYDNLHT